MGGSLVNESRTPLLDLHLSPGSVHSYPGALENTDIASLRVKRVKNGETLLLLHQDYLQGLLPPGINQPFHGLFPLEDKNQPGGSGHWWSQHRQWIHGSVSTFTVSYPVWSCYWEPGRPEQGQSFRCWFPVQSMARDGSSTAKILREAEELHTMRDIHMRLC
ncbi:hypothetical protein WISP_05942 [Willisornis vidua]|uniref:Uncharacterized protein n=1 Tax=Willisornis vidua TaxID=1566151 RepID=A0ABQ9DYR0_9PASS|nr:hypothetical protein WISP_05942 [Willisornis vidua]